MAQLLQDGVRLNLKSLDVLAAADRQHTERSLDSADENLQLLDAAAAHPHGS
jgi:myo-inositol-hexaphosphate 3-phosphohydrolase